MGTHKQLELVEYLPVTIMHVPLTVLGACTYLQPCEPQAVKHARDSHVVFSTSKQSQALLNCPLHERCILRVCLIV